MAVAATDVVAGQRPRRRSADADQSRSAHAERTEGPWTVRSWSARSLQSIAGRSASPAVLDQLACRCAAPSVAEDSENRVLLGPGDDGSRAHKAANGEPTRVHPPPVATCKPSTSVRIWCWPPVQRGSSHAGGGFVLPTGESIDLRVPRVTGQRASPTFGR